MVRSHSGQIPQIGDQSSKSPSQAKANTSKTLEGQSLHKCLGETPPKQCKLLTFLQYGKYKKLAKWTLEKPSAAN